ncbi:MAG TPA: FtsX-like permease family protein [Verrucomicrobiae bacterium]|nr:FtsX-like permease family protein [Verrucomicrobiae bacterium]
MMLLRLITWPYVRKHLLRSVLTTGGIVLGVALLVGMHTANKSVLQAFNDTVERIAGKAQLQVSAGDAGFPEEVLEKVQSLREVRAAAPIIETEADPGLAGQGKLLILAVDMTGDRSLRDYDFDNAEQDVIDDPLIFLAQPDSIILTSEFAARNHIAVGGKVAFDTMQGRKQFTVRGILKAGGMAQAFGGNLGIMDIYAAQALFGRGRHFDRIDIGLAEGVTLDRGEAALRGALGPGFTIEPPSGRGQQFESLLGVYTFAVNVSSMFALFIGMFIIYNSFAIAVTQRRPEIGILRALGATRGQVRALFLCESAIAGLVGSAAGAAVGLAFSRSLSTLTAGMMESMFGVAQNVQDVVIEPWFLAAAIAMGIATSMVAALIPARNAARVEPIQALQKGRYQVLSAGENRLRRALAIVAAALALATLPFGENRPVFLGGYFLLVIAGLLMTPFLSLELARLLRRPMRWLRPVEGALAADSLIQAPRRTSATVAALMLSLALVVGQAGVARGSFDSIDEWMNNTLNPDLFLSTTQNIASQGAHFPASMQQEVESVPGVAEVQAVRMPRIRFHDLPVMLVSAEIAKIAGRVKRHMVAGDENEMNRLTAEGKGVILSENLAALTRLRLGDTVELPAPGETLRLPVVGVIRDLSNQMGTIIMDRSLYIRAFKDDSVDVFRVYLHPGVSLNDARAAIVNHLGPRRHMFVLSNREIRQYVGNVMNQWFGLTYLQVIVAMLVAILGIVNTLTVSISDRRRELGVLRAVGGLRNQIRGTVWMEAAAIGAIGLILGVAVGAINLYYELQVIQHDLTGIPLSYRFPVGIATLLIPIILGSAFASAILPAENAVRSSLVEALEYE